MHTCDNCHTPCTRVHDVAGIVEGANLVCDNCFETHPSFAAGRKADKPAPKKNDAIVEAEKAKAKAAKEGTEPESDAGVEAAPVKKAKKTDAKA